MSYAGADGLLIRSLVHDGAVKGLVIAGLGLRNVPGLMFEAIREARARGVPVVISTRVPTGPSVSFECAKGSARALREIRCVLADDLSPQKARILLTLALTTPDNSRVLQQ